MAGRGCGGRALPACIPWTTPYSMIRLRGILLAGRQEEYELSWLSEKISRWEEAIDRQAGCGRGCGVTEGWQALTNDPSVLARWSEEAQGRLETEVPDEAARRRIMTERSCSFIEEFGDRDINRLRELYRETGSVGKVLDAMRANPDRFGEPVLEGDTIVEVRKPRDPGAFARAKDRRERQIAACFCPLIRAAWDRISLDYCHCSAGWYKGIYEGIFGVPVQVAVEESILHGDDRCRFAITISGASGLSPEAERAQRDDMISKQPGCTG